MLGLRSAAVAGLFYPADAAQLRHEIELLLANVEHRHEMPKALLVPHAGYMYSGAIAASAYESLQRNGSSIRRVVLIGPAHRVAVKGVALPSATLFDTPLGSVSLDEDLRRTILKLPQVSISEVAHVKEHALEVQLPFLQTVLNDFTLLPLVVGMTPSEAVAEVLEQVWGGKETLIVISSDLSHYLPYAVAKRVDAETVQSILQLEQLTDHDRACGSGAINGLIIAARKHQLIPRVLDLRNSGDTAGPRDQVVGYAAIAFYERGASDDA